MLRFAEYRKAEPMPKELWSSLPSLALSCVLISASFLQAQAIQIQTKTPPTNPSKTTKSTPHHRASTAKSPARHRASTVNSPAQNTVPPPPPPVLTPGQQPAKTAVVSFASGNLTVKADNSSLNTTLREISRIAAIKLTGSVEESRLYGTYGPAAPAVILSQILQGTGSNMLFLHGQGNKPSELILTPRSGSPIPEPAATPTIQPLPPQPAQPPAPLPGPPAAPHASSTGEESASPVSTPPPATTDQPSANGVKTPQQIYDELQRMRQGQPPK